MWDIKVWGKYKLNSLTRRWIYVFAPKVTYHYVCESYWKTAM